MSAAPVRRCSTGRWPSGPAAGSSCASRTPTPPATVPSGPRASSRPSPGSGSTATTRSSRAPTSSRPTSRSTARPSPSCSRTVRPTTATAPASRSRRGPAPSTRATTASAATGAWTEGAVRFRTPDEGATVVDDLIRGRVEFPNDAQEDFVIARSDGSPLYVLANAVDDITQRVTHVVRGEEHLPNAARRSCCGPRWVRGPPSGRTPRSSSTSSARSCPNAATRSPWSPTARRATWPRRWSTT